MTDVAAPLGVEHDTDPPRDERPPEFSYVVCSTPRSGSSLLCRALRSSGVAAVPMEYFNPENRAPLAGRWGCGSDLAGYVTALYTRRTTHEGVFGLKLHWAQLELLRGEVLGTPPAEPLFDTSAGVLETLFPGLRYVRILRRDVARQAISLWRVVCSGVWAEPAGGSGAARRSRAPYSFEGIDRCYRLLANGELHWDRFFRFNGIRPLEVVYEDLAASHEATVVSLLEALIPGAVPGPITAPESRKLGDARSDELYERYCRDLERRDVQLLPPRQRLARQTRAAGDLLRRRLAARAR